MNKQEAIKTIEAEWLSEELCLWDVLDIVSQIDEPPKVVVPKFVAEWMKSQKESFSDASAIDMYDNLTLDNKGGHYHEVWLWVIDNHYDFIKAWHDGYTVEQEKLYTVEIADAILTKITRGRIVQYRMLPFKDVSDVFDNAIYYITRLTEKEIIGADKRLWQFAKPVEEK